MSRSKIEACVGIVLASTLLAVSLSGTAGQSEAAIASTAMPIQVVSAMLAAPIDPVWTTVVTSATAATAAPYQPATVADNSVSMRTNAGEQLYTGVLVRAKYVSGQSLTTSPIVCVWGRKGTKWMELKNTDSLQTITLDSATTDTDDAANKWTKWQSVDAMGCDAVAVTVATAAVASSGAVSIEVTRY